MAEHGPFQEEADARSTDAVQAVYAAFDADPGPGKMHPHKLRMLLDACTAAGVMLGDFDIRQLSGLAHSEPETCAVIAGIIRRAGVQPPEGTVTHWGIRYGAEVLEYDDEDTAREHLVLFDPHGIGAIVSCQVWTGPWTEAPAPETAKEGGDAR